MKCGNCKYFTEIDGRTFCKPIKDKYGWEEVSAEQSPSVNCRLTPEELKSYEPKPKWYFDKPTEKQIKAIENMTMALREKERRYEKVKIPKTKGECSELIKSLKDTIQNNLSISGYIGPHHGYFCQCRDCERDPEDVENDPFGDDDWVFAEF